MGRAAYEAAIVKHLADAPQQICTQWIPEFRGSIDTPESYEAKSRQRALVAAGFAEETQAALPGSKTANRFSLKNPPDDIFKEKSQDRSVVCIGRFVLDSIIEATVPAAGATAVAVRVDAILKPKLNPWVTEEIEYNFRPPLSRSMRYVLVQTDVGWRVEDSEKLKEEQRPVEEGD